MDQNKTDTEIIEELLQNVKTLHEDNTRLRAETKRLQKYTTDLISQFITINNSKSSQNN
jgi:regulator of replication initiation timing